MVRGRDGFKLTGGLAKPNALLEQIWNIAEIGVGGFTYLRHIAIGGTFSSASTQTTPQTRPNGHYHLTVFQRDAVAPGAGRVIERNPSHMADFPKTLRGPRG